MCLFNNIKLKSSWEFANLKLKKKPYKIYQFNKNKNKLKKICNPKK